MSQTIEMIDPVTGEIIDQQQIAEQLLAQAKEQGVSLVGPGGLLGGLTKTVLETALGTMRGSYQMIADDGTHFDAMIPAFVLSIPRTLH